MVNGPKYLNRYNQLTKGGFHVVKFNRAEIYARQFNPFCIAVYGNDDIYVLLYHCGRHFYLTLCRQ